MGNLEMRKLIVAGGAMPLKGVKVLRAWMMLLALALPLTLTAPMTSTANADDFSQEQVELFEGVAAFRNGDHKMALDKWHPLADQGNAIAQLLLGNMYQFSDGEFYDLQKAAWFYRLSANQGNAFAQFSLGWLYENGEGVITDKNEAVRLYSLAAKQKHAKAQHNLGIMYGIGEGVFQDLEKSYMWLILAAVNGAENASEARDLVKKQMLLNSSLGPAAVKRAEKAARRCYDSNYQDCGS